MKQLRGQGELIGRLDPQPGMTAQLDDQSAGGRWGGQFNLHEGG
jgi:hypothetical protein